MNQIRRIHMARIETLVRVLMYLAVIAFFTVLTVVVLQVRGEVIGTMGELKESARSIARVAKAQEETLTSDKTRLAIQRNLEIGEALNGTIRLLNTVTIKKFNKAIDETSQAAHELARLTADTNDQLAGKLLPAASKTVTDADRAIVETTENANRVLSDSESKLAKASEALTEGIARVTARLDDPNITKAIGEGEKAVEASRKAAENAEGALNEIKEGAGYVKDQAKEQSKWTKWILGSRFASIIAGLFLRF